FLVKRTTRARSLEPRARRLAKTVADLALLLITYSCMSRDRTLSFAACHWMMMILKDTKRRTIAESTRFGNSERQVAVTDVLIVQPCSFRLLTQMGTKYCQSDPRDMKVV